MASMNETLIRKYRKKLRQIEHLESLRRPLTDDEQKKLANAMSYRRKDISPAKLKVLLKTAIRKELQKLLSQLTHECATASYECAEVEDRDSSDDITDDNESPIIVRDFLSTVKALPTQEEVSVEMKRIRESSIDSVEDQNRNNEDKRVKTEVQPAISSGSTSTNRVNSREPTPEETTKRKPKNLRNYKIVCRELEGHSDIIWCVNADQEYIISGSRDTTARVWDAKTGEEVCSLRGHTDSVNGVGILPEKKGQELLQQEEDNGGLIARKVAVTASGDCSVRVWLIPQGVLLKSIYTFNNVTCLALMPDFLYGLTGTDGGKLEIWNLSSGKVIHSVIAYENAVSCLEASGLQICSGSVDGLIKIWLMRDDTLSVIYTLDPHLDIVNPRNSLKHLKSLCSKEGRIFMGDEGVNLKVLSWKTGQIRQIKNHLSRYGCTDAVHSHKNLLVSSSYNLDTGLGCIHMRLLPDGDYLCSLPEVFTRILTLSITDGDEICDYRIVTGGMRLAVWDLIEPSQKTALKRLREEEDCKVYNAGFRAEMNSEAVISSSEDEDSDDEDSKDDITEERVENTQIAIVPDKLKFPWNYCNVL